MLKIKCAYYTKLFIMTVLTAVLYATIDLAPENPVLFIATSITVIICIRLLWVSAMKDEQRIKKRTRVRFSHHKNEYQHRKAA